MNDEQAEVMAESHGSVDFMRMNSAGGRFWMTGDLHAQVGHKLQRITLDTACARDKGHAR